MTRQEFRSIQYFPHPDYDGHLNDIMLIKVLNPFNNMPQLITLLMFIHDEEVTPDVTLNIKRKSCEILSVTPVPAEWKSQNDRRRAADSSENCQAANIQHVPDSWLGGRGG